MKVCGKKDIHVPECDDCSELEERVEAVEECCDDAHDEIDTLSTDKADKDYVDDSIETVNQTIVDVADTLGERIDNIITASEPSVTTLWEGVMDSIGDSANLSEDVNDFDYLDIYYRTSVDESEGYYNTVRIPADQFANYTITVGGTMSPLAESPILKQYLTQLSFVDDTATIDNIREWSWNGSQSSDASDDMQAETGVTIYRIDGVKEAGGNAEIADAREGVDGTVYPSLGDAIRGQIQDTRDMIPQLVKTVQGNPIVLDDAFGEVKNLTVELLPIQEGSGTPSPQNIRPITGHDSVTVGVTGKNLGVLSADNYKTAQSQRNSITYVDGGFNYTVEGNYSRAKYEFKTKVGQTYTLSLRGYSDANYRRVEVGTSLIWGNADYGQFTFTGTDAPYTLTFTATDTVLYVGFYISGAGATGTATVREFQLELGNTKTDYTPYHGQSKTVTLPHTVYGAGVGVTSGESKDKYGMIDGGDITWHKATWGSAITYYGIINDIKTVASADTANIKCSAYQTVNANAVYLGTDMAICQNASGVRISDSRDMSEADFTTAMTGVQICYEKDPYTDLSTTPTDITLFSGDNVISSDGNMELSYVQDMATVIRKIENQL